MQGTIRLSRPVLHGGFADLQLANISRLRSVVVQATTAGSRTRDFSTASAPSHEDNEFLSFSRSSLGLEGRLIRPVLATIRQLPEVETAWNTFPSVAAVDNLKRASDVFASFNKGGREHVAVCAMLAECQQRLALYDQSLRTLEGVQSSVGPAVAATLPNFAEDMILARAKVHWTKGAFSESQELCNSIVSTYNDLEESYPTTSLHMASAMTGKALSQLAAMQSMDDAYSVRDFFRIAIKFLERHPPTENSLPQAAALSNGGVAEAVYSIFLEETNGVSVPMDPALRSWFQGLQKVGLQGINHSKNVVAASKALESTVQSNLAWGVLNYEENRPDRLSKASDYAKKALAVYDADNPLGKEGLSRVLSIVASCYHQAENAVTAEGLFQSAIDGKGRPPGTLNSLQLRDAYLGYADLCKQWDRRDSDAQKLQEKAAAIEAALPPGWKGKSGIHGSLWFWTPGEFL